MSSGSTGTQTQTTATAVDPKAKFLGGTNPQATKRDVDALASITLACAKNQ